MGPTFPNSKPLNLLDGILILSDNLILSPVIPDCKLILKIEAIRSHGRVWKYKGEAFVDNQKMADAIWSATIVDKK